ncbi:hypothetical protein Zmor_015768 [Zophobas morio]|uniref:Nose resistant-to-fluoxetine protein N-terminal domain-containing protein n=1 Tax=Zophobas morio TaxID=2755281 RepID=A0AA38IKE3_9CUCU|nr:hypothetical protein Zmor_015768 [Zophobas morio]
MKVTLALVIFSVLIGPTYLQLDFLSKTLRTYQFLIFNFAKLRLLGVINPSINGTTCAEDLKLFMDAAFKAEWWAVKMLDASGKFNPGVLQGNMKFLGSYDQCLGLQKDQAGVGLDTQYCTMLLKPDKNLEDFLYRNVIKAKANKRLMSTDLFKEYAVIEFGLCIPKSCTMDDLTNLWKRFQVLYQAPGYSEFSDKLCYSKNKKVVPSKFDIYVFWFFGVTLFVELACTVYDLYTRSQPRRLDILVNFSLYTNAKRLMSRNYENETLTCLYGLRSFCIIWVILGHIMLNKSLTSTNVLQMTTEWMGRLENAFFLGSVYAVDTFLTISGLLVVYVYLDYSDKYKLNFSLVYGHRILRLTPALLATVLLEMSVVKYFIQGPLAFPYLTTMATNCEKRGVDTLFFVSNAVERDERCLRQSWYVSVDSQLYLLTPFMVFCFKRQPGKTFFGVVVVCLCSFVYTWMTVIKNNIGSLLFIDNNSEMVYFSPLCRIPVWLIGTCLGYVLYRHNHQKISIPKRVNYVLWILSMTVIIILTMYQTVLVREAHNVYRSAFSNTFCKPLWALAIGFIILSCCTGHSDPVNTFLSHPVFMLIGKLSYSIYLIHLTVIHVIVANKQQTDYFSTFGLLFDFWGYFVYILISATALCLVFETPTVSILRYLETYVANMKKKKT